MERPDLGGHPGRETSLVSPEAFNPDPGIEINMQSLSIQDPDVLHIQAHQEIRDQGQDARYNILMKLAVTGGAPRILSLNTVQQSMARAWRDNYQGLSQLSRWLMLGILRTSPCQESIWQVTRATSTSHTQR